MRQPVERNTSTLGPLVIPVNAHENAREDQHGSSRHAQAADSRAKYLAQAVAVLGKLRSAMLADLASQAGTVPVPVMAANLHGQSEEEYWCANEGLTSERRFHERIIYVVKLIRAAYTQNDPDGMSDALRRLFWVDNYIKLEPFASEYDSGLTLGLLHLGTACADRYMIGDGYNIGECCVSFLESKRERRADLELPPRPDSECWYRLYALLAALKWKGPAEELNRLMTPTELIMEFDRVEQRCLDYLERTPSSDLRRNASVRESLAWCRMEIIKMAMLWCHELTEHTIFRFNQVHSTNLTSEPGLFMRQSPSGKEDPWYWDLELFKWCTCGPASLEEALICHHWRLVATRARLPRGSNIEAYELATSSELNRLLHRAGKEAPAPE
jgi:hypothetical protein